MINLAVVNLKDVGKYLLKGLLIIAILWGISNLLSLINVKRFAYSININNEKLLNCLNENVPGIRQLNRKDEIDLIKNNITSINPLKFLLENQIGMLTKTTNTIDKNKVKEDTTIAEVAQVEQARIGLKTEVVENNVPNKFTNTYGTVQIKNGTDYNLTEEMLKPDIEINNKNIIIFHTHTCESYTPTEKYNYVQTGTYRTTDLNYSVAKVGSELTKQLESYNYKVIHDTTYHDYPAYTGSYGRSLNTVSNIINQNENIDMIFDIHRDAISDYSYAPTVKIGDEYAAQLMFVIGSDGGGLEHKNWNQNLKFAIKIQEKANELYPGLFRPILLRNSRYNQHLSKAASIIEVGATGNTMEQCLTSMKYLAKVISEVVK